MMRLVIGILLVIMAANSAVTGHYLSAAANAVFAALAGILAYGTLPDRHLPPRPVVLGLLALGAALWIASFVYPTV